MSGRHVLPHSRTESGGEPIAELREQRLAEAFVELADTLSVPFDLVEFLYTLVERCMELVEVSAVGLMFGDDRGRLRVAAASGEETRLLELFQLQNDEGPCLECYRTGRPVVEPDLAAAGQRWPLFAPEAVRAGLRSAHALPMRLREHVVGSLNLFHTSPGALPPSATRIAQSLVDVATIGLVRIEATRPQEVLAGQLQNALEARIVIEQAKGVLAEQCDITPAAAFTILRNHARTGNRGLTSIAHAVIDHEPLPTSEPAPGSAHRTGGGRAGH